MKWTLSPLLLWLAVAMPHIMGAQALPDFDLAIDLHAMDPPELKNLHRSLAYQPCTLDLRYIRDEFPHAAQVALTSYYRTDGEQALLKMSEGMIPLRNNFVQVNGVGQNYLLISDGTCDLLVYYGKKDGDQTPTLLTKTKNCIY